MINVGDLIKTKYEHALKEFCGVVLAINTDDIGTTWVQVLWGDGTATWEDWGASMLTFECDECFEVLSESKS